MHEYVWRRPYQSVHPTLIVLKRVLFGLAGVRVTEALIRLVRQFFGFPAVGRVELDLEAQPRLRPEPLAVDALVLVLRPQVLQLQEFVARVLQTFDICRNAVGVLRFTVCQRESHGIWYFRGGLSRRQVRVVPELLCDLPLQAVCPFEHVLQASQAPIWVRGLDLPHRREDGAFAFVLDVRAGLGGFGVLVGGESAGVAARPGAVGVRLGSKPLPFWIALLVFFPGGPQ